MSLHHGDVQGDGLFLDDFMGIFMGISEFSWAFSWEIGNLKGLEWGMNEDSSGNFGIDVGNFVGDENRMYHNILCWRRITLSPLGRFREEFSG